MTRAEVRLVLRLRRLFERGLKMRAADQYRLAATIRSLCETANADDADALVCVGWIEETGVLGKKRPSLARRHYARAAELGSKAGNHNLGRMLVEGLGGPRDGELGLKFLHRAARAGDVGAMTVIGQYRMTGYGVRRSLRAGRSMLRKAALAGVASAALWLAYDYDFRKRRDPLEAVRWYRSAALRGEIPAMVNLGFAYEHGDGVRRSVRMAKYWYSRAAKFGDKTAIGNLRCLEKALGGSPAVVRERGRERAAR